MRAAKDGREAGRFSAPGQASLAKGQKRLRVRQASPAERLRTGAPFTTHKTFHEPLLRDLLAHFGLRFLQALFRDKLPWRSRGRRHAGGMAAGVIQSLFP
jgi:hypothetical protein